MSKVHREKIWREHIERAGRFPGSIEAYCRSQGIEASSFYNWKRKLKSQLSFLPVVIAEGARVEKQASSLPEARWVSEVMVHLIRGLS